ncbi:hypothetical protein EDD16DRAFT_1521595 [Pisolithus croceorrhizus]|nr:hypothetical protein EDD16DRAFT_1521595 [Pisolithus croceorrhizus]
MTYPPAYKVVIKTVPVDYIYTSLVNISARDGTLFGSMLTLEDGAIPLPHSVVPEEDYSFTRSATFHNHFLQGFISDDAMTAFHVTQKPDFTDKSISYVSMTYGLPDLPSLLLSYINGVAGQNSSFHSWLLRGWSKFRIQMHSWLQPLMILPSQQVQALPSSKEYPYGKCDTVLAHVTSPFGTPICTVFALSMRGNALPPDLSYPLLYVQCFTFIATPAEQPEIRMYTVHHMFIENINGESNFCDDHPKPMVKKLKARYHGNRSFGEQENTYATTPPAANENALMGDCPVEGARIIGRT